jgi:hypothetical protein
LLEKAKQFACRFGLTEFKASQGWLEKVKKRMGLRLHYLHGEADSAPLDTIPADRSILREELAAYNPDDIFNCDETALFFRMLPNQTLASKSVRGQKMDKELVSLIDQLPIPPELRMNPDDFINIDKSILVEESMTDDEIVQFVLRGDDDNEDIETEDNEDPPQVIKPEQALERGQLFLSYWERQGLVTSEELRTLRKLLRETKLHAVNEKKQANLDKFFN